MLAFGGRPIENGYLTGLVVTLDTVHRCVYSVLIGYIHQGSSGREGRFATTSTGGRSGRERGTLDIIISNANAEPIYAQITSQIKYAILNGELAEGEALPSIRALANDLRISVITTKRAYADLEEEGFIDTVQGKGTFVKGGNRELLREQRMKQVEALLDEALREAEALGLTREEIHGLVDVLVESE